MNERARLIIRRWAGIAVASIAGAVVFDVTIAAAWFYIRRLPEPTLWFNFWFVGVGVLCGLLAAGFVAAEPVRLRALHLRRLHLYPPIWFAVPLSVILAALVPNLFAPPFFPKNLVPEWRTLDVLLPLAFVAIAATALRQLPWKRGESSSSAASQPDALEEVTWDELREWFKTEAPLKGGRDLLHHRPIAERMIEALCRPGNQSIALIGRVGSGKTSILNSVKAGVLASGPPLTIIADFNCWAIPHPEDVPRVALERVIQALDNYVDTQAIRRVPTSYKRILAADRTGLISKLLGLDDTPDAVEELRRLTPILEAIDGRLLLVIEDAERAGSGFDNRHLERLLWTLRDVDRVSYVLSFDASAGFDYAKLCDIIERVPPLSVERVEELLAPAYAAWRSSNPPYIDPMGDLRKDRLALANVTESISRYFRRTQGDTPADAITALLTTPRNLKHFIRDVDRAWTALRGEIELDDLIVMTALRHGATEVFDFIVDNLEAATTEKKERDTLAGEAVKTVGARWQVLLKSLPQPAHVQTLVDVLDLAQLSSRSFSHSRPSPQGIHNLDPVDYLGRMLSGRLSRGEVRDQDVLRDMQLWQSKRGAAMLAQLLASREYVGIWEHFAAGRLSFDESIEVATYLIAAVLAADGPNAAMKHPAMLAVWRRANRHGALDQKLDWLISQIRLALPTSLGFATDLFQYWASVRHGILTNDGRARARLALVEAAAATFTSVDALLASLGTEHPYALTRLVFPPPTDEPSDPVPFEGWSWLVDLIIEAAKRSPEKILPDVAILVGDTTHGFRTGTFEEGYLLKRDWLSKIFGSRAKEILEILAEYSGPNEYANHAKVAARAWLDEPPLDPTTTTQTS